MDCIISLSLEFNKEFPYEIGIFAKGETNFSEFNNAYIVPHFYEIPPKDGVYDFDLMVEKRPEPLLKISTQLSAIYVWGRYPSYLKGIRVHAANNFLEQSLLYKAHWFNDRAARYFEGDSSVE
ncbi:MAG: hypothetical protein WCP52_06930 [Bacteroidota bacterium]